MSDDQQTQKVYIVDDDPGIRESIAMLMETVGLPARAYGSAAEFLQHFDSGNGVLLLDVRMPGMSGVELQRSLCDETFSGLAVIFMTGHADVPMAVNALKSGATDFLTKPVREQDLLDCVQRALASNETRIRHRQHASAVQERIATLTPREQEIMVLIADGKPSKVVAYELGISQRTVEIHRARVMKKMDCRSTSQLTRSLDSIQFEAPDAVN
ncbi:MAG: response regulator [Pseudomonadota bacterium]